MLGCADRASFLRAVQLLARMAVAVNAVAAWPALDCGMPWVGGGLYRMLVNVPAKAS